MILLWFHSKTFKDSFRCFVCDGNVTKYQGDASIYCASCQKTHSVESEDFFDLYGKFWEALTSEVPALRNFWYPLDEIEMRISMIAEE